MDFRNSKQNLNVAGKLTSSTMNPLDNIIWSALSTRQTQFARHFGEARKFMPEVAPLAGLREPTAEGYESLAELVPENGVAAVFLDEDYAPQPGWTKVAGAALLQMVWIGKGQLAGSNPSSDPDIVELGVRDSAEMIELTGLTKPGPFGPRTHELGTYLGIRIEGKLVAMSGERMKIPGYTEVSAVCTHPEHTGHGYAARLMSEVMRGIRERGETPMLHVRGDNVRAIALYERLGFVTRWSGYFAVVRRDAVSRG
jgi:ribosomal protein S18 acetylase RimI-like enzyme